MPEAPVMTAVERVESPPTPTRRARRVSAWSFEGVHTVEIVAPDAYSAALLLQYAAPFYPAEIVPSSATTVRFQPPATEDDWVTDLFALIERWLESIPGATEAGDDVA